jgi:hypothetical protein
MSLLVINNSVFKKDKYLQNLPVNGVFNASCITDDVLDDLEDVDYILIEDCDYDIDELKRINCSFNGEIIVKVDDDYVGLQLIKSGAATEYYLSSNDKNVEVNNLKKAFKLASIKYRLNKNKKDFRETCAKIRKLKVS